MEIYIFRVFYPVDRILYGKGCVRCSRSVDEKETRVLSKRA